MSTRDVTNFMRQQGFPEEPPDACQMHFEGLYFQPRIVFPAALLAVALQSAPLFLALGALLWWNALLPTLNPIEFVYNRLIAPRRGVPPLAAAPAPRRFAQAVNAAFNTGCGLALLAGWTATSGTLQALLVVAFSLLVFGRFCLGAYVFHLLRGEVAFANSTLPWRGPPRSPRE